MIAPQLIEAAAASQPVNYPPVTNPMTFEQVDTFNYFILDPAQTYSQPDPPEVNSTAYFTLGGIWIQPAQLDHIRFQCHLFGVLAYDESFPDTDMVFPGGWTYSLPFDIPPVVPNTTYYVTISGWGPGDVEYFTIETAFRF